MQNGFVSSKSTPVVPRVGELVRCWEAAGGAIVFTRFVNHPGSPYERLINWSRMQTAPETTIVDELTGAAEQAVVIVGKPIYSLFTVADTKLVEQHGWIGPRPVHVLYGIATVPSHAYAKRPVTAFELSLTSWIVTQSQLVNHRGLGESCGGVVAV